MRSNPNSHGSIIRVLATAAVLAAVVAAAVAWIAPDAGAARAASVPDDGVELVWGLGGPPTYAPAAPAQVADYVRPGDLQLEWGRGGPPRLVPAR